MQISSFQRSFWLLHLAFPVILAVLLIFLYPHTNLDSLLIQPFFDTQALVFPLKQDSFLENVMHQGLKNLMIIVSLMILGFWLLGLRIWKHTLSLHSKSRWLQLYHRQFLWVFVGMVITTSSISILKHLSIHACPWSLIAYGGAQPLIPLFGSLPTGVEPGHCFPGGHASGGFALMAFYFGFRDTLPRLAEVGLILGLAFGFAMGWAQMMRGAHFLSHNLWTAWVIWMLLLVQYLIWPPKTLLPKA